MNSLIALTNLEPRFEYSLRNIAAPTPNGSAITSDIRISMSVLTIAGARVGSPLVLLPNRKCHVSAISPSSLGMNALTMTNTISVASITITIMVNTIESIHRTSCTVPVRL